MQLPKTLQVKSWDDKVILDHLKEQYESRILDDGIIIIMVLGNIMPTGTILEDNESKSYTVMFDVIVFYSKNFGDLTRRGHGCYRFWNNFKNRHGGCVYS